MKGWTQESHDMDSMAEFKTITGRITKSRYKIIHRYVRIRNYHLQAPYGRSEDGYAYSCGHEWDCCGCLCGGGMQMEFKNGLITLIKYQSYNY